MPTFISRKERKLWGWVLLVLMAIYLPLFIGQPLEKLLRNQDVQAIIFALVMILIAVTILIHALNKTWGKTEITVLLGIVAVYTMLFLRLGLPERSHLMEYSILAIFVHRAFVERYKLKESFLKPILFAFVFSVSVGIIDEVIQIFLPDRVFDPEDILFNTIAVTMALGTVLILTLIRNWKKKSKNDLK